MKSKSTDRRWGQGMGAVRVFLRETTVGKKRANINDSRTKKQIKKNAAHRNSFTEAGRETEQYGAESKLELFMRSAAMSSVDSIVPILVSRR